VTNIVKRAKFSESNRYYDDAPDYFNEALDTDAS
jgi:hypothetical protein